MHNMFALAVLGLVLGVILTEIVYGNEQARPSTRDNPSEDVKGLSESERTSPEERRALRRRREGRILARLSDLWHHHTIPGKHA